jgi:hypothetical protein
VAVRAAACPGFCFGRPDRPSARERFGDIPIVRVWLSERPDVVLQSAKAIVGADLVHASR